MNSAIHTSAPAPRSGRVLNLGTLGYEDALDLQVSLRDQRIARSIPDTLVLLEHPPVITVGRSGNTENVLVSDAVLKGNGIELYHTNRGGDVTYHGPGQLVGYTILDLKPYGLDIRLHLRRIEEVVIQALKAFDIPGTRVPGATGVWVKDEKIASIGLHIKRWVTMHGFALNLQPQLHHFSFINPCGIRDKSMTSMARLLGRPVEQSLVRKELAAAFGVVFGLDLRERSACHAVS